ncbi:MAG: hypothetical protein ABI867_10205 [Kofleriaceae bacterium]
MATHSTRALRIGLLLGDQLVEERVFKGGPISIGQSLRANLSIPVDGVPLEHVLFVEDQGRLVLRPTPGMTGRLAYGSEIRTELVGDIPIERGARGKLHIGRNATLLFQEIATPVAAPRMQLPASVRGTLGDRIDARLAIVLAASLLVHIGIGTWAMLTDRVSDELPFEAASSYEPPRYDIIDLSVPDVVAPPADPTPGEPTPGAATPVSPRQTPKPIVGSPRIDDAVDPDRWAQVMTGNVDATNGQGEIRNRSPGADLDKQIADIRDRNRDVRVGNNPTTRDYPTRPGTGPDGPRIDPGQIAGTPKREEPPTVRIIPGPRPPQPGEGVSVPTAEQVVAKIQGSYLGGLQRCYSKFGLAIDAKMSAKVTLTFTVDERGLTSDTVAAGTAGEVDSCIQGLMPAWRFAPARDKDGDPTDAPFRVVLVLQPPH